MKFIRFQPSKSQAMFCEGEFTRILMATRIRSKSHRIIFRMRLKINFHIKTLTVETIF